MGGWCERVRQEVGAGRSKSGLTSEEAHIRTSTADSEAPARPSSASSTRRPASLERPPRPASAHGPRSGGASAAPDPGLVYGVSQQLLSRKARRSASAATLSSRAAPSVATGSRTRRREDVSAAATPAGSYLRLLGLEQYAPSFADAGLADLWPIARLSSEGEAELLERLRPFPGHRAKLLRAIEGLRRLAALGREAPDSADAVLEQLHVRHELVLLQKDEAEEQLRILQAESHDRLLALQQRDGLVTRLQERVGELEEATQSQTHQVNFLAMQLQRVLAGAASQKAEAPDGVVSRPPKLTESQPLQLAPEQTMQSEGASLVSDIENVDDGEAQCESPEAMIDFQNGRVLGDSCSNSIINSHSSSHSSQQPTALPRIPTPQRSTLVRSLSGPSVAGCVTGERSEPAILCFAAAVHQRLRSSAGKTAPADVACNWLSSVFDDPKEEKPAINDSTLVCSSASAQEDGTSLLSGGCSALGTPFLVCPAAVEEADEVRGYVQELTACFQLQAESGVIALIFLDRFLERTGVQVTSSNWRRLTAATLMLALKVWDEDPFENAELAQMCPHSLNEVNGLESAFLRGLRLDLSVPASAYARAASTLRDCAHAPPGKGLRPLDPLHASRLEARCRQREAELRRSGLAVGQSPRDASL